MNDLVRNGMEDIVSPKKSPYAITKQLEDLFYQDHFFSDTHEYILNIAVCTEYFLEKVLKEDVKLNDVNAVYVLFHLRNNFRQNRSDFKPIKELYFKVLGLIETSPYECINQEYLSLDDQKETLQENYAYGPYIFLCEGMSMLRNIAQANYIKKLARRLKDLPDILDLDGEIYIEITNVKHQELIEFLKIIYLEPTDFIISSFTQTNNGWQLRFSELGMKQENYIFMHAAYQSICEPLAYMLEADVQLVSYLND